MVRLGSFSVTSVADRARGSRRRPGDSFTIAGLFLGCGSPDVETGSLGVAGLRRLSRLAVFQSHPRAAREDEEDGRPRPVTRRLRGCVVLPGRWENAVAVGAITNGRIRSPGATGANLCHVSARRLDGKNGRSLEQPPFSAQAPRCFRPRLFINLSGLKDSLRRRCMAEFWRNAYLSRSQMGSGSPRLLVMRSGADQLARRNRHRVGTCRGGKPDEPRAARDDIELP